MIKIKIFPPVLFRQTLIHNPSKCTGCGICSAVCSEMAITITEKPALLIWSWPGECSLCGQCVHACPNGVLQLRPFTGEAMRPNVTHACSGQVCCHCGRAFTPQVLSPTVARLGIQPSTGSNWLNKLCEGCRAREIASRLEHGIAG